MSRFDSDVDYFEAGNPVPRPNATCPRCGDDFLKGRDDIGDLCDRCCADRDAAIETPNPVKRIA